MFTRKYSALANYALTLAAVSVATLLRFALAPLLGPRLPFILYYPTVFLCTTLGGVRAGLLSTALGGLAAWFIFIPPQFAFKASDPSALTHLILFLFLGVFISLFGENIFRTRKRSEDHLTTILESISDGFQSFDADYRYVYVNAVTKRIWAERGFAGDVIGRRVFDVFPEARDTEIGLAMVRAMTGRVPVEVEAFSVVLKRWVANRYFPTPDGGVLVFTQDITERKKSEEAMLSANEQLRLVTDIMAAPVTRCSRDLKYLWVSKPYADWLGLTPGEIVGLPIVDVIGREAFADLRPHFERVLSGEVVRYEEQVNFRGIGPRWIRAVYSPTFDPAGEPDGWVAVVIDIEDLKQAEEALKEANRHKDDFLALLGHELRNPLSGITNALHVLRQTRNADAAGIRALDVLERQTRQMKRLIDDLLEVTRITRGKITLKKEMADLVALVRSTVEDHRGLLDGARLALRLDLPSQPIWVEGDPTRLAQILVNVLANAAKFTTVGGEVTVGLKMDGDGRAALTVRDTGIGIEPEALPRVFEPFVQAERGLNHNTGGLGLGLSLVKGLAELHGGEVRAHSDGVGKGAAFTVLLPVSQGTKAAPDVATPTAAATPAQTGKPLSILVIEDDRDSVDMLCAILGHAGYKVESAHSGHEGLMLAQQMQPDAVICDIGLPGVDGYEVAAEMRRNLPGCYLVAMSGYGRAQDKHRALAAGFNHHLTKPVDFDELERLLLTNVKMSSGQDGGVEG